MLDHAVPEIAAHTPDLIRIRRHLHRHPELSNEEHETSALLAAEMEKAGIAVTRGLAGTGVVGIIQGLAGAGRTIALRGDMDALPITEERDHEYRSTRPGLMHACGHDAHCSVVLAAAKILQSRREGLRGRVKILFQPSEEADPSGAEGMIRAGVLEGVDAIVGIHVFPFIPAGNMGVKPGPATAASDQFEIAIHGRGGHAGYPHLTVDPIVISAHVILALQTIASRRIRPNDPVVVTVGVIDGGTKGNVIPPVITLKGTFRSHTDPVRRQVAEEIERIAQGVCSAHGATAEVKITFGCPSVQNDLALVEMLLGVGRRVLGDEHVQVLPEALMGADDFAFYQEKIPGVYFRLGTGNPEKGSDFPLHHPKFDIDEEALPIGAALLTEMAQEFLNAP